MTYRVKILTDNNKIKRADLFSMKHLYYWHEASDLLQRIYVFMQHNDMTEAHFEFHVYDGRRDLYVIEKNIATLSPYDKTNLRGLLDRSFQYDTDDRSIERINRMSRAIDIQIEDEETYPEKYESLNEKQRKIYDNHFNGVYREHGLKGLLGVKRKNTPAKGINTGQVLTATETPKKGFFKRLLPIKTKKTDVPDNIETDGTSFTAQIHANVDDILDKALSELNEQNTTFLNTLRSKIKEFDATDSVSDLIGNYHRIRVSEHAKDQIDTIQTSLSSLKERTTQAMLSKVARYDKKLHTMRIQSLDFNRLYDKTREDGFDPNSIVNDESLSVKKKNLKIIDMYRKYMTQYAEDAQHKYTESIDSMNKTFKDSMNDLVDTYLQKENVGLANIKRLYEGKNMLVDDNVNLVKLLKDEEQHAKQERLSQKNRKRFSAQAEAPAEDTDDTKADLLKSDSKQLSKENKKLRLKSKLQVKNKLKSLAKEKLNTTHATKPKKAKSIISTSKFKNVKMADDLMLRAKQLFTRTDVKLLAVIVVIVFFMIGYIIL